MHESGVNSYAVILCEPRILTVNQWLADTKTHDSNKEKDETRIDYKEVILKEAAIHKE